MSVGAWEPKPAANTGGTEDAIPRALLQRYIDAMQADTALADALDDAAREASYLIRMPAQRWLDESANWNGGELWQLIRFFTLAEQQLAGWDAGAESAVIPLAKALRQRRAPLDREQLQWIKQHSDNRYLPYGPL
ncbi:hypothetical protein [Microbulbifer sp. SAOS-129_SWC]|uniref:hypothetical protein n=1 Tax=Microbulbifer sp. SAOS-129_SWC TaxID=3145235 RepID=UPI0032173BFC